MREYPTFGTPIVNIALVKNKNQKFMKKNVFLMAATAAFALLLSSCSSSHKVAGVNLNGTYTLSSVDVRGVDGGGIRQDVVKGDTATFIHNVKVNTTIFDDASPNCFQGSTWVLPHNGYGSYTINSASCGSGVRNIIWSIRNDGAQKIFQLKILDGRKAKTVQEGYLLNLNDVTAGGFTLSTNVSTSDGKQASIVYTFVR